MTSHVTPDARTPLTEIEQTNLLMVARAIAIQAKDSAQIAEIDRQLEALQDAHIQRVLDGLAMSQCLVTLPDEAFLRQQALEQAREQFHFTYNAYKASHGMTAAARMAEAEFDLVLLDHGFDPAEFEGDDA